MNLTAPSGSISTANYPNIHPANTRCTWHIRAPEDYVVKLVYKAFDVQSSSSCTADYVKLSNTGNFVHDTFRTYCGSNIPNAIYSSGKDLWVRFVSNLDDERQGFSAVYSTALKNAGEYWLYRNTLRSFRGNSMAMYFPLRSNKRDKFTVYA